MGDNIIRLQWLGKTGPACMGVVFIERAEQWLTGNDIHVNPRLLVIPVFIRKRRFGAFVLRIALHRDNFSKLGVDGLEKLVIATLPMNQINDSSNAFHFHLHDAMRMKITIFWSV
jgi:hypothetical protein